MSRRKDQTLNVYRVTSMTQDGSYKPRKSRPQRGTGTSPEYIGSDANAVFETKSIPATSLLGAYKRAVDLWPERRIVAVDEVSMFQKNDFNDDIINEIIALAHEHSIPAPEAIDYSEEDSNDIHDDDDEKAELIFELVNMLSDTRTIPGLSVIINTIDASPDDEVILMLKNNYTGKNNHLAKSLSLRDFGDSDIVGWDWVLAITQEIIEYSASMT